MAVVCVDERSEVNFSIPKTRCRGNQFRWRNLPPIHTSDLSSHAVRCGGAAMLPNAARSKGSPFSTAEHRVPELIPVLDSQPASDVSHKPGGRLPITFRQACSYPRNP